MEHIEELTQERIEIARRYSEGINNDRILIPTTTEGTTSVWHQYVIRCEERNRLMTYLGDNGVGTIIHYPVPPHLAEAYQYLGHKEGSLPITEHMANTVLSIPMYNGMTKGEQDYVIDVINAFK